MDAVRSLEQDTATARSVYQQPAEKVYKNIVIFKGKTAEEVIGAMRFMNAALGVHCDFCHDRNDYSSDEKPTKGMARSMYYMTEKINNQEFSAPEITCYTCHGGRTHPLATPLVRDPQAPSGSAEEKWSIRPAPTGVTLAGVIDAYTAALGGRKAVEAIVSRRLVGSRNEAMESGQNGSIEILARAHGSGVITTVQQKEGGASRLLMGTDGRSGWARMDLDEPRELRRENLEEVSRLIEIIPGLDIKRRLPDLAVWGRDGALIAIGGTTPNGTRERLDFDTATGLLLRRRVEVPTILGYLPFVVEYSDYRKVGGVMTPHTIRWRTPEQVWTDTFSTIENNPSIPDSVFVRPAIPARKR